MQCISYMCSRYISSAFITGEKKDIHSRTIFTRFDRAYRENPLILHKLAGVCPLVIISELHILQSTYVRRFLYCCSWFWAVDHRCFNNHSNKFKKRPLGGFGCHRMCKNLTLVRAIISCVIADRN